MKLLTTMVLAGMTLAQVNAATVAVIDSGTDMLHEMIKGNTWTNTAEIPNNNRDEDNNGYQDDYYGWNFAEQNGAVIDYKYVGTFSPDPKKFFEIQGKIFQGTATSEDIAWMRAKQSDQNFRKEMQIFGNFVHGTHVAGITIEDSNTQAMAVKLLPTEVKPFVQESLAILEHFANNKKEGIGNAQMAILKMLLGQLAVQQMTMLTEIATYVASHGMDVANGSFGTGYAQALMIVSAVAKKATKEQKRELALHFINSLTEAGKEMMASAPKTLFVFAAGNDGSNNDEFPTSPANIQAANSISVAASYGRSKIATFSNFGMTVDVAAPGVLINSAIPGSDYLRVSGTSQAAPYVANVAAQIKDINPNLTPSEIKQIIMGTVDVKAWLRSKVKTSGIVNLERAKVAAQATAQNVAINTAIAEAVLQVADVVDNGELKSAGSDYEGYVMPMPSGFAL